MASQDVLCLSLDDIIKMKNRGRGGRGARRGRGRGRGATAGRDAGFLRGDNVDGSGIRGRGRGARVLSTKIGAMGSLRDQSRGRRGGLVSRARGALVARTGRINTRGGRGINARGGRGINSRGGRGINARGGRGTNARGGRGTNARGGRGINGRGGRGTNARGGRGTNARGGRGINARGGRGINTRGGRGINARGRGESIINRLGQGRIANPKEESSSFEYEHQETYQQMIDKNRAFSQQIARRKIQQARRTLAMSQQNNRNQARHNIVDARRGIAEGMKTKGNLGTPLRVRVGSGTIVRGLRSDQLLLHKMKHSYNTPDARLDSIDTFKEKSVGNDSPRGASSVVSHSSQWGLTVSIKNNIASLHSQNNGTVSRSRPRLNRNRMNQFQSRNYAPGTFTVVNDHVYHPPEPPFNLSREPPRKLTKRNIISKRDPRARMAVSMVNIPPENVRTIPEPHRQILDPKVQKEIAMLQGKDEISLNNGPGPGVKGFRHIPSQTTRSLNERFTEERIVTA
nr:uncharacterized protein LOC123757865 isoform X2 [Procambarus clarkii]